MFSGIQPIEVNERVFRLVRLHRNNRFYGFLLNVCQLIYENSLPTEKAGEYLFMDFTRDEAKMSRLFESFIRNFYYKHLRGWDVGRTIIDWRFNTIDDGVMQFLPRCKLILLLKTNKRKLLLTQNITGKQWQPTMTGKRFTLTIFTSFFSYLVNQRTSKEKTLKTKEFCYTQPLNRNMIYRIILKVILFKSRH